MSDDLGLPDVVEARLLSIYRVGAAGGDGHPALAAARRAIKAALLRAEAEGCDHYLDDPMFPLKRGAALRAQADALEAGK